MGVLLTSVLKPCVALVGRPVDHPAPKSAQTQGRCLPVLLCRRISCRQLAEQLEQRHPAVLMHLLDRLLQSLGVRQDPLPAAAGNGGSCSRLSSEAQGGTASMDVAAPPTGPAGAANDAAAAAAAGSPPGRGLSFRSSTVARLLQLREKLAVVAAAAAQQRALAQRQSRVSTATAAGGSRLSWFHPSLYPPSLELSHVTVASEAGAADAAGPAGPAAETGIAGDLPDVWHVESTHR